MVNIRYCMTALDHYCSYIYYAWSCGALRHYDLRNLDEFLQTALSEYVFEDRFIDLHPDDRYINELLNEASKISVQMLTAYICKKDTKFLFLLNRLSEIPFFYKEN